MAFLYSIVLLVLAGGIHCSPVPRNFSFEVNLKLEVMSVRFGSDAVFNCKTNDPTARVTLNVSLSGYPSNVPVQPGKITRNGTTFTVHNIIVHDGGKYMCVAERGNRQVIKRDILLTIDTSIPEIAIIPFMAKQVLTGSHLTYTCEGTMGSLAWYKVTKGSPDMELPTPSLPGVRVISSFGKYKIPRKDLVISNADKSHRGFYMCQLTDRGSTLKKSVHVDVKGPEAASITSSSPHDIWAVNNQDIELDCQTSGFPRPTVTWKRDNQEIKKCYEHEPCARSQRYLVTYNGLKIVKPRYPDDDAVFRCEASNPFGKAHRDFVVVVPVAPVIADKSKDEVFWTSGQSRPIIIPCVLAQGSPTPSFKWSLRACFGSSFKYCFNWKPNIFRQGNKNSAVKRTLEIAPTDFHLLSSSMQFSCTVQNVIGKDVKVFKLMLAQGHGK